MGDENVESSSHSNSMDLHGGELPNIYVETVSLIEDEIPNDAISMTTSYSSLFQYWKEVARYVIYEEIYDDEAEVFNNAQCPAVPYHVLERLLIILRDELEVVRSDAREYEDLVVDMVMQAKSKNYITTYRQIKNMESILLASRWHPDISPSQNRRMSVLRRRVSNAFGVEEGNELTNKALTRCLPKNCEAFNIMVGQMPCLKNDFYLLVRVVANPLPKLAGVVEVDIGTRFVFLALTPKPNNQSFLFQLSRCLASMLGDPIFLESLYQSHKNKEFFKAALKARKEMNMVSMRYSEIVNKTGGIEIPRTNLAEVNFDRSDLVGDDVEEEKFYDVDITAIEDKQLHCTLRACKRFWPPFRELCEGLVVVAKRMPSDYVDAFRRSNIKTVLSSIFFIYFVVFGPSITFGTLMCKPT
nr:electrogenic sodium bicarbonate cotransporter [Hymenolepis microstoma]